MFHCLLLHLCASSYNGHQYSGQIFRVLLLSYGKLHLSGPSLARTAVGFQQCQKEHLSSQYCCEVFKTCSFFYSDQGIQYKDCPMKTGLTNKNHSRLLHHILQSP